MYTINRINFTDSQFFFRFLMFNGLCFSLLITGFNIFFSFYRNVTTLLSGLCYPLTSVQNFTEIVLWEPLR